MLPVIPLELGSVVWGLGLAWGLVGFDSLRRFFFLRGGGGVIQGKDLWVCFFFVGFRGQGGVGVRVEGLVGSGSCASGGGGGGGLERLRASGPGFCSLGGGGQVGVQGRKLRVP